MTLSALDNKGVEAGETEVSRGYRLTRMDRKYQLAFTLGVVRLDQGNQALPRHHLIHFDRERLLTGLLALAGVLGVGKSHLLHRETRATGSAYISRNEKSSSGFPLV
jgi:hypothetical protein